MYKLVTRNLWHINRNMNKYKDMMTFYSLVGRLKKIKRSGWVRKGVEDPETISGHMYRMSIMAMTMCEPDLRKDHCMKLCLVHDMAECIVGDYTPCDGISKEQKYTEETNAMRQLGDLLPQHNAEEIQSLFQEFEEQKTPESIFVKDLDRLDMILQAYEYENDSERPGWLQEFFDSTEGYFKTQTVKDFVATLKEKRSAEGTK
uniref:5'-deoxynucleotidase HDDC2-like n=1 Tax=Styela clava TaxID=7725 RepID=UPI00193A3C4D|nr:5'-deoxynucleotidase HDDC2-like [Styela clava]